MMPRGGLIVFEGIDGSGKSTQLKALACKVYSAYPGQNVLMTREPTWRAKELRKSIENDVDPRTGGNVIRQQFLKDRVLHCYDDIRPARKQRTLVLSDRFSLSTFAYQWAQGEDLGVILKDHQNAEIDKPDFTVYMDVPIEVAMERIARRPRTEKFETDASFLREVRDKYLQLMTMTRNSPILHEVLGDIIRIDGTEPKERSEEEIWKVYQHLLAPRH